MSETNEARKLRMLIEEDEQTLASLQKQEKDIVEHVPAKGFRAATSRVRVISEIQTINERLHENRERLADLKRRSREK